MAEKKSIRLLVLDDSKNEVERLVSVFRNAGHATRVMQITTEIELKQAVASDSWDLLICSPNSSKLQPKDAVASILRSGKDIPTICLLASHSVEAEIKCLRFGATATIVAGNNELLLLVCTRELKNIYARYALREAEIALHESEKRCELLLDSSRDAIAYIHDGMHIYGNRTYLEMFGYDSSDDLAGIPIIDLIAGNDQGKFRKFIKDYQIHNTESAEINCQAVSLSEQEPFEARMSFSPASYDGEKCMQVVIRSITEDKELEEKLREISSQDLVTGLYNRKYFLDLLDTAAERALKKGQITSIAYIKIDKYQSILSDIGLTNMDLLIIDIAKMLNDKFKDTVQISRFSSDVFALMIQDVAPEDLAKDLEAFMKLVSDKMFDIDNRTVKATLSIGIASLNSTSTKVSVVLERVHQCATVTDDNTLRVYDPAVELAEAAAKGNVVAQIKHSLKNNKFKLLYQPVISLRGDKKENYQTLLRMIDSDNYLVTPDSFLDVAISSSLGDKVDRWVVVNAVRSLINVQKNKPGKKMQMFIHLTRASLQDKTFLTWLSQVIRSVRLPADSLVFCIDEQDAVTYLKQAHFTLQGLAKLHCHAAINQFGKAEDPFYVLKYLTVSYVCFAEELAKDIASEEGRTKLKKIIDNLQQQQKLSIVPFVESAGSLANLWQVGAHYIKGNYLQAPSEHMNYDFNAV